MKDGDTFVVAHPAPNTGHRTYYQHPDLAILRAYLADVCGFALPKITEENGAAALGAVEFGMTHIFGHDRSQMFLLPEAVDDYVGVDNPVRFIDAFVDGLYLAAAGFARVAPKTTGRPGYAPGDLLIQQGNLILCGSTDGWERERGAFRNVGRAGRAGADWRGGAEASHGGAAPGRVASGQPRGTRAGRSSRACGLAFCRRP